MAAVALVGLERGLADLVEAGLRGEGHAVARVPLDAGTVRALGRRRPDAVVLDGHAYANTRVLLTDLRAQPATAELPVVLLGPARPAEVPHFEVMERLGRAFELDALLAAVRRALGATYTG
ncbi:MAG TPA: hypothetical protein VFX49_17515 [Chloroflexota bacterium]|nr:hypothetical protein [Chloroflexota bacterium]